MATLAQFRNIVAETLKLDNSTSGDQGLIDEWVNDAVNDLLVRGQVKHSTGTMSLSSGVRDYTLDTSIYGIVKMYNSTTSSNYQMTRVDEAEMLDLRIHGAGAAPALYYATGGANLLLVHPTPGMGETIQMIYVPAPTALSVSSDTPSEVPAEWHDAIKLYALAKAAEYMQHRPSQYGMTWWGQYEKRLREIRKAKSLKGGSRLGPARLASSRPVPHDRSTYPL